MRILQARQSDVAEWELDLKENGAEIWDLPGPKRSSIGSRAGAGAGTGALAIAGAGALIALGWG